RVMLLPIAQLREKSNHPFKVMEDDRLHTLAESIRENGLLHPIIVRATSDKSYEILSGHRRTRACMLNGAAEIKAIVVEADDELANRIMIVTNFQQRDTQFPSEIAKSYLIRYTDLKRRKRAFDENSNGWNFEEKIDRIMEKEFATSKSKVYMYIHLNELIPELMDALDAKRLNIRVASELSYLTAPEQKIVYELVFEQSLPIDLSKAAEIKRQCSEGELTESDIRRILTKSTKSKDSLSFTKSELKRYKTKFTSYADMKQAILQFLENYRGQ
ncbi:MAG: ParB/RepB/Spo0J family partition protein, partial [Clostridia bacterium]|nr:ParB/RepB/Spo0J family partition protein [Clostridia bacterium]